MMINIHENDEQVFRESCSGGFVEVAKWLMNISKENDELINIHAQDEKAFIDSYYYERIEVVKWLCSLCYNYYVEIKDNKIVNYRIIHAYDNF